MPKAASEHKKAIVTRSKDTRQSAALRGYDYRWQKFRTSYLSRNPLCSDCMTKGKAVPARDIHHKKKLADYPDAKYDEENLLPLCTRCHTRRTNRGE